MKIGNISKKNLKTTPNKIENQTKQTNPFGVSFKGNIINADVFELSKKTTISFKGAELAAKVTGTCKMKASAFVGSINDMASAISSRFNSVLSFGNKLKGKVIDGWRYLNDTTVVINVGMGKRTSKNPFAIGLSSLNTQKIDDLSQRPVSELRTMLEETIAERAVA